MIEPRHTKKLYAYARTESARTKYKVNKGVLRQMKTIVLLRECEIRRYKRSHKKLKLMFNPSGLSVSSLKINFISCYPDKLVNNDLRKVSNARSTLLTSTPTSHNESTSNKVRSVLTYDPFTAGADFPFVNGRCHSLTVDAIISDQAFWNGRCLTCSV